MTDPFMMFLPELLLILLGGLARNWVKRDTWRDINRLSYRIFFPALLFHAASGHAISASDVLTIGLAVWALLGIGFILGLLTRSLGPEKFLDFAGIWQTSWRFNSALAFVVMTSLPPASAALMSAAIGVGVPMANLLAVGVLSHGTGKGHLGTLKLVAMNPFLLASMAGLIVSMSGIVLPSVPMQTIGKLAGIAVPLALLSLGANMDWRALHRLGGIEVALNTIKLIALPLAALIIGYVCNLPKEYTIVLVAFAALPTATVAHIMASVFGADSGRVSTITAQSTMIGLMTLPCWIFLAQL